ncbi:ABC transporter substrate-binding protein [Gephyromycinifex aptenodytis]|uniref:ABC transporter substrate-binding protein n=1 Tax=Gephyromycinifex aptenodytis TaxID=2716227 RepID=UPI001445716C|nr:ABC transporter substrate-binding protein [Gephyromycinifex aptenodytis]
MTRTKRPRVVGLLGAVLSAAMLLSACGTQAEPEAAPATSASQLMPAAEGHTKYPLTLTSEYGETVLEERPERVAAIVPNAIDTELLMSLGVTPVLSSKFVNEGGYLDSYGAGKLTTYDYVMGEDIPIEAIAASKPDLIVAVGWVPGYGELRDYYDKLSTIAPVVTSPKTTQRIIQWQDSIRPLGEALDLSDAAEKVIKDHDARFAKIRQENPQFSGLTASWAIYYGPGSGLQYFSQQGSAPAAFLRDLGFSENPLAAEFANDTKVSDELLSKIDADVLVLGQSAKASEADMTKLTSRDLFQNLRAVSSGHFVRVPPKTDDGGDLLWAITSGGPIGNAWAAEHLVPMIADVL